MTAAVRQVGPCVVRQSCPGTAPAGATATAPAADSASALRLLFTEAEIAQAMGVSPRKVEEMRAAGLLPPPILLDPRLRRWTRQDLEGAIAALPREAQRQPQPAELRRAQIDRMKAGGTAAFGGEGRP